MFIHTNYMIHSCTYNIIRWQPSDENHL